MARHANSELAAMAWLKTVPGLPIDKIGTTLPQDPNAWAEDGFIQPIITGKGSSSRYYGYRAPVVTVHCWAVNPTKQTPPWWKANELAENIHEHLLVENNGGENIVLPKAGYRKIRILQAWVIEEPKRIPWGFPSGQGSFVDPGNAAHYTVSFQMAWAELPE
jgi:hypothetical protein